MEPGVLLLVVAVAAVAVALIVFGAMAEKKRREALNALARKLGWRFDPRRERAHDERFRQFDIFRRGHGRAAYNSLLGEIRVGGRTFEGRMGDFVYKRTRSDGDGSRTETYRFSYLLLRTPWGSTPEFRVRPEGLFDKLAGAIGFDDIDFESAEFSRGFHVKCADKRLAYDVISPRMMEFLLKTRPPMIEIDGGWCCFSDGRSRWSPEEFEASLAWLGHFFELWPEFVIEQLGGARVPGREGG